MTTTVTFPVADPEAILALRAGDEITIAGEIVAARDRTLARIFDHGAEPPVDLAGAFLLHAAPNVRRAGGPGRYETISLGVTATATAARYTAAIGERLGVRAICGKGALPADAAAELQRLGMVYLAIPGGASLDAAQVDEVDEVAWAEHAPECLWRFRVSALGPLIVAVDAHGGSVYREVRTAAQDKLKELYARL